MALCSDVAEADPDDGGYVLDGCTYHDSTLYAPQMASTSSASPLTLLPQVRHAEVTKDPSGRP